MSKFVNGLITGGVAAAAGAYYLVKNKDKGRHMIRERAERFWIKPKHAWTKPNKKCFNDCKKTAAEM